MAKQPPAKPVFDADQPDDPGGRVDPTGLFTAPRNVRVGFAWDGDALRVSVTPTHEPASHGPHDLVIPLRAITDLGPIPSAVVCPLAAPAVRAVPPAPEAD